ncbi:hypothetical protein [Lelliottia wanjuensis]|uniref:hypothetical protein n=1 Tax=Lelliottia wanjuensis TaxID=3050585 RepID=UPI00254F17B7|nr:hypothetical protein [Lelliottia sp. V89_5]
MASAVLRAEKEEGLPIVDLIIIVLLVLCSLILAGAGANCLPAPARLFVTLAKLKTGKGPSR